MKKLILMTVLVGGLSTSMYAQGTVQFDTTGGGLIYLGAGNSNLVAVNLNGQLLGGTPLTSLASLSGASALTPVDFGVVAGDGSSYQVPGTPVGTAASLQVLLWDGSASSYATAAAGGANVADSGLFTNPTGGAGQPPGAPATLTGMPSLHLLPAGIIPEPSMIALGCLGFVSMMVFRRRN